MRILPSYRSFSRLRRYCLLLAMLLLAAPTLGSLGSLGLRATPEIVRADGHSTTTITAEVRDSGGGIVADGTEVHFTTTAGRIDEVVPTVAGRARATFTSDAIAGVAQVSAFSGASSGTISVRMVDDPQALGPAGRVLTLDGKYVAYSESRGVMEAIGEAHLTWKGQRITAKAIQADLANSVIRAQGGVTVYKRGQRPRGRGQKDEPTGRRGGSSEGGPGATGRQADGTAEAGVGEKGDEGTGGAPAEPVMGNGPAKGQGEDAAPAGGAPAERTRGDGAAGGEAKQAAASGTASEPSASSPIPHPSFLSCDRLALDMASDQATVVTGDARQVIDLPSLAVLTGTHTAPDALEWADLTNSDMLWVADRIIAVPGQKVQLRKTSAYVGGQRILRLPYHEVSLEEGVSSQGQQYVGVGTYGLSVDLPYYLGMSPGASTSLRLRRGVRSGFGWYGTNPGWELDLERRYGLPGATEGTLSFGRLTSSDWGMHWNHTQQLAPGTQAYALVEYPAHRDLYANLNLSEQGHFGSLGLNLSGHKLQNHSFGRTIDLNAQTNPHPISGTGLKFSFESRLYDSRGGDFVAFDGKRYEVAPSFSRELGLRLTPAMLKIGRGGVSSWLSLKEVWGSQDRSGFGLAGAVAFNHPIGRTGGLNLNYSYNRFPGNTFYGTAGQQNLSGSLRYSPFKRLFLSAFGSLGLDSPSRTMSTNVAYSFGPLWRLELQQTAYHFRTLQEQDLQIGLSRVVGARELTFYWSTLRHRLMFDIAGGAF